MHFVGNADGLKAMKGTLSDKETRMSLISFDKSTHPKSMDQEKDRSLFKRPSRTPSILEQEACCTATRLIRVKVDKPWKVSQILESVGCPLKHIDSSQSVKGVLGLYFFSLTQASQVHDMLVELDMVKEISYRKNLSTFQHCDCVLFDNRFNLTEPNIWRFLGMIDKVVLLKKLSMKRYFVKFDTIRIQENIARVMDTHFWQFDKRYYQSLICFTEANYDYVFINMTNPLRLKFCNMEDKAKYRHLDNKINLKAISDEQDTRTTVMIKNIPNRIQKNDLIDLINDKFYGKYDFIYLPIDFQVHLFIF